MNKKKNLQDAVVELRRALGLNQTLFARRIGVSTSTVYRWETQKPPRGPVLTRLSELSESLQRPDLQGVFKLALGESVASPSAPVDDAEIPPTLQHYLQMLAEILASGDAMAIDAVTRNIDFFRDRLRPAGHKGR
ncbi:MAG: helix-turn-helix domain-containing protein [Acidobacteriia bacterium]|nr:helix-turn-helix domain-containing protein [Terriglobia bacterium]